MSEKSPKTSYGDGPEKMDLVKMRRVLKEMEREGGNAFTSMEAFHGQHGHQQTVELTDHAALPSEADSADSDGFERRDFFKMGGMAMTLLGLTACTRQPAEKIVPYVKQPEELIPGKPLFFATSTQHRGLAVPLLVESHMGRPTKIEGNPEFPGINGGTNLFAQADIFNLFDPDRSKTVTKGGVPVAWFDVAKHLAAFIGASGDGSDVHIVLEPNSSPTLHGLLAKFRKTYPKAKFYHHDAAATDNQGLATKEVFGEQLAPVYDLAKADVVLDLNANVLDTAFHPVSYAAGWASRRDLVNHGIGNMSRLYSVETSHSPTGMTADHRLALSPSAIREFLNELASELGIVDLPTTAPIAAAAAPEGEEEKIETIGNVEALTGGAGEAETAATIAPYRDRFLKGLIADFKAAGSKALITVGENLPVDVQALAFHVNAALGVIGSTLTFSAPVQKLPGDDVGTIGDLAEALKTVAESEEAAFEADRGVLMILGGNPAYDTPADLEFADRLQKAGGKFALTVHAGYIEDETASLCDWHIPLSHFLESWGDARAIDGTTVMQQPLIAPLYASKSLIEIFGFLAGRSFSEQSAYELIRKTHMSLDDKAWQTVIHDGYVPDSAIEPAAASVKGTPTALKPSSDEGLDLVFAADPTVWDGRYANNEWLQEMSKPVSTLTWDNAVIMSPTTARELGVGDPKEGFQKRVRVIAKVETVDVTVGETVMRNLPLYICPGHADNCFTLHLGYGRAKAGRVGTGIGFNAYQLMNSETSFHVSGATVAASKGQYPLAMTQDQHQMVAGRALVRSGSTDRLKKDPHFVQHLEHKFDERITLYPDQVHVEGRKKKDGNQWGMAIDLNRCVSCNACLMACASENNVVSVGKEQVMRGREMSWIRMDRYFQGDPFFDPNKAYTKAEVVGERDEHNHRKDPKAPLAGRPVEVQTMPVNCMQCELAPCETVCPVGATVHSNDGLNMMVYNRCVGTRYCSNNCPYKVRRFNFYQYTPVPGGKNHLGKEFQEVDKLTRNPNVTVRVRGVMEKCTYCVQRINSARIDAKVDDRPIADGEIKTACQQACPTNAIVFGDLNDETSEVVKYKNNDKDLNYALLGAVNTRPRTTYLARIRNINQDVLPDALYDKGHH